MKDMTGKKLFKRLRKTSMNHHVRWEALPLVAQDTYDELADLFNDARSEAYYDGWHDGFEDAQSD